ncbi:aromatic ring-opening dioxygenase subunit LigA [Novosphingobium sp.]|uniref:aromatic ring-opening dioxygenase subunit LigA n=1 Tax=Novosphingobium sp. TaxID=1874826 RepID=UPI002B496CCD|nr:aromatic ring-opening dioxygenase subunit LigA [Novosphingobium sp.]HKR91941.1 aromatic ring-opening dioxygenase subunit LigA [Novosphingobium sp.]
MSLYHLSKLLYTLNRDDGAKARFRADATGFTADYRLTDEERTAVLDRDIGLLYVLGVNGQILMHFAALCEIEWSDYLQRMRDGVAKYGPVRAGIYAMTTGIDEKVAGA